MTRRNAAAVVFILIMIGAGMTILMRWQQASPRPEAPVTWRQPTPLEDRLTRRTITRQLQAFKADDFATAYSYQSSYDPAHPPVLEGFRQMVRSMPIFSTYRSFRFGDIQALQDGSTIVANVFLIGDTGTLRAHYSLDRMHGTYKIHAFVPAGFSRGTDLAAATFPDGRPSGGPPGPFAREADTGAVTAQAQQRAAGATPR